ncbi:MAG: YebC/PmpR family DNA-binding transcriptional regulator [Chloroflexi bacterium]|nr:YebC/PmpR family DNA-binding transcriptional regulator [Chloroflexota bacterium]
MSGHSKWSQIKHQKSATDAKRGQLFTKLIREITVAARQGGSNPDSNVRLRLAIEKARQSNMPLDNIERAVKRAAGQGDGQTQLEEVLYEGYGPGGVALMVYVVTDNRNRSVSLVRAILERGGGKLGQAGSVSWLFEQKGVLTLEADPAKAEAIALQTIDLGAEDFTIDGPFLEVRCAPERFEALRRTLEAEGVHTASAEIAMVPKTTLPLDEKNAEVALRLLDRLEESDDVQRVYTNADFPNEVLERYRVAA